MAVAARRAIGCCLLALLLVACAQTATQRVLVVGHRGSPGHRPEHTVASYKLAIEQAADYIEPDVVITKDGVLIVRHENEIGGTTDVAEKFPDRKTTKVIDGEEMTGWFAEDFTLAEIKTLRARERLDYRSQAYNGKYEVLTLDEVIAIARAVESRAIGLAPETKHPSYHRGIGLPLEEPLVALLDKHGYTKASSPVIIQSFEAANLQRLRKMTRVRLLLLLGAPDERPFGDDRTYGDFCKPDGLQALAKYADAIGPPKQLILPPNSDGKPTTLVSDAHDAGLLVIPWTFRDDPQHVPERYNNDPAAEYLPYFELGVDAVFSDFPDTAVKARARFERR